MSRYGVRPPVLGVRCSVFRAMCVVFCLKVSNRSTALSCERVGGSAGHRQQPAQVGGARVLSQGRAVPLVHGGMCLALAVGSDCEVVTP